MDGGKGLGSDGSAINTRMCRREVTALPFVVQATHLIRFVKLLRLFRCVVTTRSQKSAKS